MSPEQARGKPVDKRADIWAFGVGALRDARRASKLFQGETVTRHAGGGAARPESDLERSCRGRRRRPCGCSSALPRARPEAAPASDRRRAARARGGQRPEPSIRRRRSGRRRRPRRSRGLSRWRSAWLLAASAAPANDPAKAPPRSRVSRWRLPAPSRFKHCGGPNVVLSPDGGTLRLRNRGAVNGRRAELRNPETPQPVCAPRSEPTRPWLSPVLTTPVRRFSLPTAVRSRSSRRAT